MSYKTIVVHVDDSPHAPLRYDAASRIALTAGAHLIGLASTGLTKFFRATVAMDFASLDIAPHLDALRQRAGAALDEFAKAAAAGLINAERRAVPRFASAMMDARCSSPCALTIRRRRGSSRSS